MPALDELLKRFDQQIFAAIALRSVDAEETLVVDPRARISPAQAVEQKLRAMLAAGEPFQHKLTQDHFSGEGEPTKWIR